MKRVLKNKRGAILATAVMFMTVLSFMGILLTSILLYSHVIARANDKIFQTRLTLDQIGEYFVAGQVLTEDILSGYQVLPDENPNVLKLTKNGSTVILYIEKDETGKVLRWQYSDLQPTPPENE